MERIMKFELYTDNEEAVFGMLDDELFFGELDRERLEAQQVKVDDLLTDVDEVVYAALDRALTLTIPEGKRITNATMK